MTTTTNHAEAGLALLSIAAEALGSNLRLLIAPALALLLTAAGCGQQLVKAARRRRAEALAQLSGLTVRELRQLARSAGFSSLARSGRKADLLAALAGA
jgi:hypothetical protein